MSLHTKKEFRALAGGVTVQNLSTYIKRGSIIIREDGYIDDSEGKNKSYLSRFQIKNGGAISITDLEDLDRERKLQSTSGIKRKVEGESSPGSTTIIKKKPEEKKQTSNNKVKQVVRKPVTESVSNTDDSLDAKKKILEIEKLEKDVELKNIDIQKKLGQVIPVDMVKELFARHNSSFVISFNTEVERLSDDLSHYYGVSREDVSKFRGKCVGHINNGIKEAMDITSKEIEGLVNEYKTAKK